MTPAELAEIGRALHGARWQRALARTLDRSGIEIASDPDGKRMRRWASGVIRIPPVAATALRALRARQESVPRIERMIAQVRAESARHSLVYAQILLRLERAGGKGVEHRDLCVDYGGDPDSSTVSQAVQTLERLGLITVDRGAARNQGYLVKIARG